HIGVLDAVVHHLHEVPRTIGTHMRTAGHAVVVRSDRLQHRADGLVPLGTATGHHRWAVQGTLFTTGDPHTEEVQALLPQRCFATARVLVMGVAAVDDDVAFFQQRHQG